MKTSPNLYLVIKTVIVNWSIEIYSLFFYGSFVKFIMTYVVFPVFFLFELIKIQTYIIFSAARFETELNYFFS